MFEFQTFFYLHRITHPHHPHSYIPIPITFSNKKTTKKVLQKWSSFYSQNLTLNINITTIPTSFYPLYNHHTMQERLLWLLWWISLWQLIDYLWINQESLTIFSLLLILDFIFWLTDAYLNNKSSIKSKTAIRWLINKLTKLILPSIVIIILKGAWFENTVIFASSIIGILIIAEGYSIIGHIYSINTWKSLPEIDAFEMLIRKLWEIFKELIETFSSWLNKDKTKEKQN